MEAKLMMRLKLDVLREKIQAHPRRGDYRSRLYRRGPSHSYLRAHGARQSLEVPAESGILSFAIPPLATSLFRDGKTPLRQGDRLWDALFAQLPHHPSRFGCEKLHVGKFLRKSSG